MENDFDGFTIHLFHDVKDQDWGAHFVELPAISAFGDTPQEALEELKIAWQATKESYQKRGEKPPESPFSKTYSGQFNVRIDKRLHKALAIEASQYGLSLNGLVSQKLGQLTPLNHI